MVNVPALVRGAAFESTSFASTTRIVQGHLDSALEALQLGDAHTAQHFAAAAKGDLWMFAQQGPSGIPGRVGAHVDEAKEVLFAVDVVPDVRAAHSALERIAANGDRSIVSRNSAIEGLVAARDGVVEVRDAARRQLELLS